MWRVRKVVILFEKGICDIIVSLIILIASYNVNLLTYGNNKTISLTFLAYPLNITILKAFQVTTAR